MLRADGHRSATGIDMCFEPVDEDDAAGRWRSGRQQQGVISPRARTKNGARRKAPESVGFEPLRAGHQTRRFGHLAALQSKARRIGRVFQLWPRMRVSQKASEA